MSDNDNSRFGRHFSRPHQEEPEHLGMLLRTRSEEEREGILGLSVEHDEVSEEQRRRMKAQRRNVLLTAGLVFSVALIMIISIMSPRMGWFQRTDYSGSGNGTEVSYTVPEGASTIQIANDLESHGVIADANKFVQTYTELGSEAYIQPGEYKLQEEMSSESALHTLLNLDQANKNYVAINQTWRSDETYEAISKATGISVGDFNNLDKNPAKFGIPSKFPSLEGWLHPGEYHFEKDASAEDILQTLVDRTKEELKKAGVEGDERTFHVLTVASILEFEGRPTDYPAIAGAIENRMNNPEGETSGYIQSDATVAYGLGKHTFQISTAEKNDASNKYNTFYYKGLPAGPIGSPADAAIDAAAAPENNDYYFWVTVNTVTGETKFAKTYQEHLKNVEEYDNWCSENKGKCD